MTRMRNFLLVCYLLARAEALRLAPPSVCWFSNAALPSRLPATVMLAGKSKRRAKRAERAAKAAAAAATPAPAPAPAPAPMPAPAPTMSTANPPFASATARPAAGEAATGEASEAEAKRARRAERRAAREGMASPPAATQTLASSSTPVSTAPAPAPGPAANEPERANAPISEPLFEDSPAMPLPSFDAFRAKDAARKAKSAAYSAPPPARRAPPPAAPTTPREREMELQAFDTIDLRPAGEQEYDLTAKIIGRGLPNKAGVYLLPYLQTGHMLLAGVLFLSALVSCVPRREAHTLSTRGMQLRILGPPHSVGTGTRASR